jgi:hypothetical protein
MRLVEIPVVSNVNGVKGVLSLGPRNVEGYPARPEKHLGREKINTSVSQGILP